MPPTDPPQSALAHRRHHRAGFNAPAKLQIDALSIECTVVDLSLKGALVHLAVPGSLRVGAHCALDVVLAPESAQIRMEGAVAHLEHGCLGMAWDRIDLHSLTHLRRLLALNFGDDAMIERGLAALLKS